MNKIKNIEGISVIVPIYNTASYLKRCLNSILQNTYKELEVICINDGSTDNSLEVLEEFVNLDKRVKIINKDTNQGVSAARNTGLEIASKKWIAFIDSDDWIHPQYFEMLITAGRDDSVVVACGTNAIYKKEDVDESRNLDSVGIAIKNMSVEQFLASGYKCMVHSKIYLKERILNIRFNPKISLGEDTMFNVEASYSLWEGKISVVEYPLYYYFQREDSTSHVKQLPNLKPLIEHYIELLSRSGKDKLFQRIYVIEALKLLLNYRYLYMFDNNYNAIKKYCNNQIALCWDYMKNVDDMPKKEYVKYYILIHFPIFYRIFRIMTDKTMLKWEREQKKNRKTKSQ